jgi:hypothetical protein
MTIARRTVVVVSGVFLVGSLGLAQEPSKPTTQRQTSQPGLQALDGQTVTVTGCLMREADVPGRQPTPTERAGILPDFILTNVQVKSASPGGATGTTPGRESTPPAAGARGLNVKLVKVDNDEMKTNLNRLVEVTGKLDADGGAMDRTRPGGTETTGGTRPGTGATGTDQPLAHLEVQSVRVVNQSCTPAK